MQTFHDRQLVVARLVDRHVNHAASVGHRLAFQARQFAFNIEVAHFLEVRQTLVEGSPCVHADKVFVVREVSKVGQT